MNRLAHWHYETEEGAFTGYAIMTYDDDVTEETWRASEAAAESAAAGASITIKFWGFDASHLYPQDLANALMRERSGGLQTGTVEGARLNNLERDLRNMRRKTDEQLQGITDSIRALADLVRSGVAGQVATAIPKHYRNPDAEEPEEEQPSVAQQIHELDLQRERREVEYMPPEEDGRPPAMPILGKPETRPAINRRLSQGAKEVASRSLELTGGGPTRTEIQEFDGTTFVKVAIGTVGDTLRQRSDIIPVVREQRPR